MNFYPSHTLIQWRLNVLYSFGDRGLEEGTWWRFMHSDVYSFDSHDLAGNQSTCLCTTVPVRSSTCWHSGTAEQPWPLGQHLNRSTWCQWDPGLGNEHLPPFAMLQGHIWLHSEIQVSNVNLQLNSTRSNEFTWFQTVDWGNCLCGKQKNQICLPVSDCWSKKPSSVLCSLQVNLVHWYIYDCMHPWVALHYHRVIQACVASLRCWETQPCIVHQWFVCRWNHTFNDIGVQC